VRRGTHRLVQDQRTCLGMVGATLVAAQGRHAIGPYHGNPPVFFAAALGDNRPLAKVKDVP
jgi:hypothetical protein